MPITGAWLASNRRPDPQQAVLHQLDGEHAEPGSDDPNPSWQADPYQDVGALTDVSGLEWITDAPGLLLDRTPTSHDEGGPRGLAGPGELARAHAVDYGADEVESRREAPFRFVDDRHEQTTVDGLGPVGVAPVALLRGLNSDPENNPALDSYEGRPFRFGWYRRTWVEHNFRPPWREHTHRIIRPNTATEVGDAPPPSEPGPYNSPFASLARSIRQLNAKPAVRRVPEPTDANIVDDGLGQPVEAPLDWVVG